MKTVTSKDGTTIAFDQFGQGPALILVGGAFELRTLDTETAKLAALPLLAEHFAVYHYDRRGRGDSTDTLPFAVEREYRKNLDAVLADGRRGDAVGLFMMLVGMPAEHLEGMRQHPMWPMFESVAPTLAYDAAELGDEAAVPTDKAARLTVPTLVMDGSESFPFMHPTAVALAKAMPHGQQRTLEGQTHEVSAEVLAPVLIEFFSAH